jgi:integrase
MNDIDRPQPSAERERILSGQEITAVWRACDIMGYPFGYYFQLLLLTAQRRTELAGIKWSEINFSQQTLTIPRERTKTDRTHIVHLSQSSKPTTPSTRA